MTGTWIGIAVVAFALVWFLGIGRRKPIRAPEDDIDTPVNHDELTEAERAVKNDPDAKAAADAVIDDDEDWGPGSSHSPMPGVLP